jgi:uncharacterized protein (DUF1697 family)
VGSGLTAGKDDVPRYVALLRAVNVGGRTLAMSALRAACESSGCTDVQTYIQSGNLIVTSPARSAAALEQIVHDAVRGATGMDVAVLARSASEMRKVVDANPFAGRRLEARTLHVTFLARRPAAARVREIDAGRYAPDVFAPVGREIYLHLPNGYGRTKLGNPFFEKALGGVATTRNWNTVTKLADLASR